MEFDDFINEVGSLGARMAADPFAPALEKSVDRFHEGVKDNFARTQDSEGATWPPRKPRPDDDGHPLLIKTGALLEAATSRGGGGIVELGDKEAAVGVSDAAIPYSKFHQGGTQRMPRRQFYYATEETMDAMGEAVADHIAEAY